MLVTSKSRNTVCIVYQSTLTSYDPVDRRYVEYNQTIKWYQLRYMLYNIKCFLENFIFICDCVNLCFFRVFSLRLPCPTFHVIYTGSRWRVKNLTYKISKYPSRLNHAEVDTELAKAFSVWSDYTDLTFTQKRSGQVHIEIRYVARRGYQFCRITGDLSSYNTYI